MINNKKGHATISIGGILFFTFALVMGLIVIILALGANTEDKIVNCYDNFSNKVIDAECINKGQSKSMTGILTTAGVVMIFIGFFIALFMQYDKNN